MGKSVRVNLSLPPEVASVVSEVAQQTGRSVAGVVMEALSYRLPHFRGWLLQARQDGLFPSRNPFPVPEAEPKFEGNASSAPLSPVQLQQRQDEHRRRRQAAISRERKKRGGEVILNPSFAAAGPVADGKLTRQQQRATLRRQEKNRQRALAKARSLASTKKDEHLS